MLPPQKCGINAHIYNSDNICINCGEERESHTSFDADVKPQEPSKSAERVGYTREQVYKLLEIQKESIRQYVDRRARDIGNSNFTVEDKKNAPLVDVKNDSVQQVNKRKTWRK